MPLTFLPLCLPSQRLKELIRFVSAVSDLETRPDGPSEPCCEAEVGRPALYCSRSKSYASVGSLRDDKRGDGLVGDEFG